MWPQIGAYGTWNVKGGGIILGRIKRHLGGTRFQIQTDAGMQEFEFDTEKRPVYHPNDSTWPHPKSD